MRLNTDNKTRTIIPNNDQQTKDKTSLISISKPLDDHLDIIADIIIERILEERSKNASV